MKSSNIIVLTTMVLLSLEGCAERFSEVEIPTNAIQKMALYATFDASDPSDTYVFLTKTNDAGNLVTWNFNRNAILSRDTSNGQVVKNDGGGIVFDTVAGAKVQLFRNDTLIATLQKSVTGPDGVFKTGKLAPFTFNATYKIVATAPNFETIESVQKVQTSVKPDSVYFSDYEYSDKRGTVFKEVIIEFQDPPNEVNNYEISLTTIDTFRGYESFLEFDDQDPNKINYYTISDKYFLTSDKGFNGQRYKRRIGINKSYVYPYYRGFNIYFKAVNKDYEDFIKLVKLLNDAQSNPFVEPFQPYSNVKNGYGFFLIFGEQRKNFLKI